MINIITHSRTFHIDEIMAIALLKTYIDSDFKIIRTRDSEVIKKHQENSEDFVIDVGFNYNHNMKNFDHHQKSFSESWNNGNLLSSCGLIWNYLKKEKILHQKMNKDMMRLIEDNLIKKVDDHDNGVKTFNELSFITMYNRNHHDPKVMDRQFNRALTAAIDYYHNFLSYLKSQLNDKKILDKAIKDAGCKEFISLKQNVDCMTHLSETDYKIVILPHSKGKFIIKAVSEKNDKFNYRVRMPKAWRGKKDKELEIDSGIKNLEFCHKTGFMCILKGSLEDAENLSKEIIIYNKHCL